MPRFDDDDTLVSKTSFIVRTSYDNEDLQLWPRISTVSSAMGASECSMFALGVYDCLRRVEQYRFAIWPDDGLNPIIPPTSSGQTNQPAPA